jgi:hypothetical protein
MQCANCPNPKSCRDVDRCFDAHEGEFRCINCRSKDGRTLVGALLCHNCKEEDEGFKLDRY